MLFRSLSRDVEELQNADDVTQRRITETLNSLSAMESRFDVQSKQIREIKEMNGQIAAYQGDLSASILDRLEKLEGDKKHISRDPTAYRVQVGVPPGVPQPDVALIPWSVLEKAADVALWLLMRRESLSDDQIGIAESVHKRLYEMQQKVRATQNQSENP